MTDPHTLSLQAERCRRMARLCVTEFVARKFEALSRDYDEYARRMGDRPFAGDLPRDASATPRKKEGGR